VITKVKTVISLLILLVAVGVAAYDYHVELLAPAVVAFGTGLFVVFAIWVFPDVKRKS
jgi:membrane protein YdbS with pleckstrin-like domain